jgi:site-specific DNA-methyltransferase (adenine-specific)
VQADFRLGKWQDVLADVDAVDALITDCPYSARTHGAYVGVEAVGMGCRSINYAAWEPADVEAFVASWAPRTRGWFVTITDTNLAPVWSAELERAGRYVFSPLACLAPGSRLRISGDGPAQWSVWAIVARPKTRKAAQWGSLPGGYVVPPIDGAEKRNVVMGCKSLWLMRALVRDYSRPGDLVCDPCAGGATTLLAALQEGRRAVGAEMDPAHYEIGRKRLAKGYTAPLFVEGAAPAEQLELTGNSHTGADNRPGNSHTQGDKWPGSR